MRPGDREDEDARRQRRVKIRQDHKDEDHKKWEELPDDLWDFIFAGLAKDHLKNVSLVCKSFLSISSRSLTDLFIPLPRLDVQPTVSLQRMLSRFTHIESIQLWDRDLKLDDTITQIANSNLSLKCLSLYDHTHFPREAMRLLGRKMSKTLRSLSFKDFSNMNNDDIALIGNFFPYLQKLKIEHINDEQNLDITDVGILEISTKLNSLVSLTLSNLYYLSHRSLEYLASNCSLLCKLRTDFYAFYALYNCNACVNQICLFSQLTSLKLTARGMMSKFILAPLCRANSKLEKLNLYWFEWSNDIINGQIFCQFLKSLGNLRSLTLKNAKFPSGFKANDFTASIPSIQEIHLSNNWQNRAALPPATLYYLLKNCRLIERISISGNLETRHRDWLRIPSHHSLRSLCLKFCGGLTYRTLMRIVSICPRLFSLKVKGCSHITNKGFLAIIRRYKNIEYYIYDY